MTKWNKNIYRTLIIGSFVGLVILIVFGISQTLSYLNTGADRSSMLRVVIDKTPVYVPKIIWEDTINPGRPIEKQTQLDIQKDYLNAWYVKQVAFQTHNTKGIEDYYTASARKNIERLLDANAKEDIRIESTTINHHLFLDFYSADGQLVVLSDKNVKEYQRIYKQDQFLIETQHESDYQVMLLLEDGYWRVRHMVKEKSHPRQDTIKVKPMMFAAGKKIFVDQNEYQIKGINYYPQKTPWDMFGDGFDLDIIAKDFDIIKGEGLNTIRIFIQYEDFGKAFVKAEKLLKLKQVLDTAETKGIKVIITLFDFYGDYSVLDWTLTHRHAEQITSAFKNHKAILAWDIKNEPNLDFKNRGKQNVMAWLQEMAIQIKKYDPNHLVTIGWSDIESVSLLQDHLDIVSFHYYQDIDDFSELYKNISDQIDKPMVLQEFGLSSNRGFWSPFGASQKKQAEYHHSFQSLIKNQNIHYLSWTLYDFENVPSSVSGKFPWRKHKQKHFGFIDHKGNTKEAFEYISN